MAVRAGNVHSGLTIRDVTASRIAGRSLPVTDSPCLPLSISNNPVHHLLRMTVLRSRSSGLKDNVEWVFGVGSQERQKDRANNGSLEGTRPRLKL